MYGIQHPSAWWAANNPVLLINELAVETDTRKIKYGNGVDPYLSLRYSGFVYIDDNIQVDEDVNVLWNIQNNDGVDVHDNDDSQVKTN